MGNSGTTRSSPPDKPGERLLRPRDKPTEMPLPRSLPEERPRLPDSSKPSSTEDSPREPRLRLPTLPSMLPLDNSSPTETPKLPPSTMSTKSSFSKSSRPLTTMVRKLTSNLSLLKLAKETSIFTESKMFTDSGPRTELLSGNQPSTLARVTEESTLTLAQPTITDTEQQSTTK